MATADDILRRMADDPAFAAAVRTDPVEALRGIALTSAELRRVEQVLDAIHGHDPDRPGPTWTDLDRPQPTRTRPLT